MGLLVTLRKIVLSDKWEATRAGFQTWTDQVIQALSGQLRLDVNSYADIVTLQFTQGAATATLPVPLRTVTSQPIGVVAIAMRDTTDPQKRLQVPSLTWHYDGTQVQIDALDPTTVAQLITAHVYQLTVYVLGG